MTRSPQAGPAGSFSFEGRTVAYEVVRSDRRTLAITVLRDGTVRIRSPRWLTAREIERSVKERAAWIVRKRAEMSARDAQDAGPLTPAEMERARELFAARLDRCWAAFARPGEPKPTLKVRAMRTRWGSFSARGNVTLNAALVRAAPGQLDYVIFHELCHMRVRGHGPDFYAELGRYVPGWKSARRALRDLPL